MILDRKDKNIFSSVAQTSGYVLNNSTLIAIPYLLFPPAGGWKNPSTIFSALLYFLYIPNDGRLLLRSSMNRHGKLFRIGIYIDT